MGIWSIGVFSRNISNISSLDFPKTVRGTASKIVSHASAAVVGSRLS